MEELVVFPNTIIGGAPRAGTTSVFRWLQDHPQVATSSTKETRFFYDADQFPINRGANYHNSPISRYEEYFAHVDPLTKVVLEASPGYLCSATALRAIPSLPSEPKIILILRKPSDRLFSSYTFMMNARGLIPPGTPFRTFLRLAKTGKLFYDPFEHSRYSKYVGRWIEALGNDRVGVFLFEEIKRSPRTVMKDIASFIGIDAQFWDAHECGAINKSPTIRNRTWYKTIGRLNRACFFFPIPMKRAMHKAYLKVDALLPPATQANSVSKWLADDSREELRALDLEFRPEVRQLSALINRDLSIWE
jgi:hypothetical protein